MDLVGDGADRAQAGPCARRGLGEEDHRAAQRLGDGVQDADREQLRGDDQQDAADQLIFSCTRTCVALCWSQQARRRRAGAGLPSRRLEDELPPPAITCGHPDCCPDQEMTQCDQESTCSRAQFAHNTDSGRLMLARLTCGSKCRSAGSVVPQCRRPAWCGAGWAASRSVSMPDRSLDVTCCQSGRDLGRPDLAMPS
jgi:hypothetical protein